eukprot:2412232-Rhodomonas_salina.1
MSAVWVADHLGPQSYGVGSEGGAASDWLWGAISALVPVPGYRFLELCSHGREYKVKILKLKSNLKVGQNLKAIKTSGEMSVYSV